MRGERDDYFGKRLVMQHMYSRMMYRELVHRAVAEGSDRLGKILSFVGTALKIDPDSRVTTDTFNRILNELDRSRLGAEHVGDKSVLSDMTALKQFFGTMIEGKISPRHLSIGVLQWWANRG